MLKVCVSRNASIIFVFNSFIYTFFARGQNHPAAYLYYPPISISVAYVRLFILCVQVVQSSYTRQKLNSSDSMNCSLRIFLNGEIASPNKHHSTSNRRYSTMAKQWPSKGATIDANGVQCTGGRILETMASQAVCPSPTGCWRVQGDGRKDLVHLLSGRTGDRGR